MRGLLSGDLRLFKDTARFKDNVFLMAPYRPGLIPLVLVHGTASSPARWAELINEIQNDRELWGRYQIWLFTYNTGNPHPLFRRNTHGGSSGKLSRSSILKEGPCHEEDGGYRP